MMKTIALLVLLGAAAAVNAQLAAPPNGLNPISALTKMPPAASTVHHDSGRRKLMSLSARAPSHHRKLMGTDVGQAFTPVYTGTGAKCPSSGGLGNYPQLADPGFGELVVNNGICGATGQSVAQVTTTAGSVSYGGAAQDFGTGYGDWETYGWSLFQVPAITGIADEGVGIRVDGINLHVIGGVGIKSSASPGCSIKAVSIAIFAAGAANTYTPVSTPIHMVKISLPGSGDNANTFSWNSNSSAVLYTDIVDLNGGSGPTALNLTAGNYYWLRVKLFADYLGTSGTGKCFAFWGLQSIAGNGLAANGNGYGKARWQEGAGGAKGYSTTCTGAATSGTAFPSAGQTLFNCFNNGAPTTTPFADSTGRRRCLSYRTTLAPPLATADCTAGAQFNDFNFALFGNTGLAGVSGV